MLYYLLLPLAQYFSPLNLIRYVTVRSMIAVLLSLIISFIFYPPFIRFLKRKGYVQIIRSDGPSTHMAKQNTPTMGGVFVLLTILVSALLSTRIDNRFIIICIACIIYLGLLGWIDDYLKIIKRHPRGVNARWKLLAQIIFALSVGIYFYLMPLNKDFATKINIPYLKETYIDIGIFYVLFVIFIFVASSNAVNLTDGLDGLAMGCVIISAAVYAIFAYLVDIPRVVDYLKIVQVKDSGELTVLLSALIGAGLGFLWFNSYPAEIFLGDSGSLFLGGLIGLVAIITKQELILPIVGGIFLVEVLSVILQVYSYKRYKKRIFRMAPLHHHFELKGLTEPKITMRFWLVNIILALIALSSLKIR